MQCSVVIPCFNETPEVLSTTVRRVYEGCAASHACQVIVVDDGSTRHSYSGAVPEGVELIRHHCNRGYGWALQTGIARATHEWIAIVDSDSTYPAQRLGELLAQCGEYDMVVGARPWKDISLARRFPKFVLTRFASFLADAEIPDLNSGMRVFRKRIYSEYIRLFPKGFSFTSTLTMICLTRGFEVKYVPIEYFNRSGSSSIQPVRDTVRFFALVTMLAIHHRPLRVFIPLSAALLVTAVLRGLRDMHVNNYLGGLCLVLFFLGFQVFFFGLLAEMISKKG